MLQTWRDLLFAHWPVSPDALTRCMPEALRPDEHSGSAWIGIVPFRMTGIRPYGLPAVPVLSETLELNVRTYATVGGVAGVYFFSLDAASRVAVRIARRFFHLPYFDAAMSCQRNGGLHYRSRGAHGCRCSVDYEPIGPATRSAPGSLDYFLTERYALYTTDTQGRLYRGRIRHDPWPLQPARAVFHENTMTERLGLTLIGEPVLRFSEELKVSIQGLERC